MNETLYLLFQKSEHLPVAGQTVIQHGSFGDRYAVKIFRVKGIQQLDGAIQLKILGSRERITEMEQAS